MDRPRSRPRGHDRSGHVLRARDLVNGTWFAYCPKCGLDVRLYVGEARL